MARRSAAAVAETPADEAADKALDNTPETVSEYRTGSVSEGETEYGQAVAKRLGWTPKEEWTRDPSKWRDWDTYLDDTPKELDTLKERLRRTSQAAADAIEDERRRARIEAQSEIRAAAEAGDPDRAARAAQQLERTAGPPPQTVAWMSRNEWFNHDEDARMIATAEVNRLAQQGASIEDQLAAAEAKVKKIFPQHFGATAERKEPEAKPDARRAAPIPPQQHGGTRSAAAPSRSKSFADIPAGDRAQFDKHFRKGFEQRLGSKDAAEQRYAATYWREKSE
jgi:hypothetical protein